MAFFSHCCNLLSEIDVKSLHKTAGDPAGSGFYPNIKNFCRFFLTISMSNFSQLNESLS